jgi:hypothetical protein
VAEGGRVEGAAPPVTVEPAVVWAYLAAHPGKTAYEVARRALRLRTPLGAVPSGRVLRALRLMEAAGQVSCREVRRPGQGGPVSEWRAVPGAFSGGGSR